MAEVRVEAEEVQEQNGAEKLPAPQFSALKPQLMVPSLRAEEALLFYIQAFGAEEVSRVNCPKRKAEQELPSLLCAEIKIGSASLLVCDRGDDTDSPKTGGEGAIFQLETEDVEAAVSKAVKAGAVLDGEFSKSDPPCGGVTGKLKDPFGYVWIISSPGKSCASVA